MWYSIVLDIQDWQSVARELSTRRAREGRVSVKFGVSGKWERLHQKHPNFIERLPALQKTSERAMVRRGTFKDVAERVVFSLGGLCAQDFGEILLMCEHGYGFGAIRLLRSMYERAV
jgi:hypothetical protein